MPNIVFDAPPTVSAFMKSDAFMRVIAGPVGSGKTTGCIFELFRRASEQARAKDGYRYTRFAIVRQTLSQLKMTVLKDIIQWLPQLARFKVSENTVYVWAGDIRSEWLLIPLENPEDQGRLLSSQLTGAWLSEAIEIDVALVGPISGRCGRFPSGNQGAASWRGIIADTNMPSIGSEWHRLMDVETPPDWQIFVQPGGFEPDTENLMWLDQTPETILLAKDDPIRIDRGRGYYRRSVNAGGHSPDWIERYVNARYGNDPSGTAVYRESFVRDFHVVSGLEPALGHPLIVGQDFGRDPCSLICQMDHKGRFLVLEEVMADDIGLELHLQRGLRPALMQARFMGHGVALVGDPAGVAKDSIYEETSFDVMKRHGFMAFPAPTNDIDPRIRSIESFLLAQRGGKAAMVINAEKCPNFIAALGGGYRYKKARDGSTRPVPDKTGKYGKYTHIVDAGQYAALAAHGGMAGMISSRLRGVKREAVRSVPRGSWT